MPAPAKTLRVLIVDDHPMYREGLRQMLGQHGELEVIGEACEGASVLEAADRWQPDVVLMDIGMPDLNGIEATRALVASLPGVAVIMLTADDQGETVLAAVLAGARGYLLKDAGLQDVRRAVSEVGRGGMVFGPDAAEHLLAQLKREPQEQVPFPQLTPRERAVLTMLADGRNTPYIAREFGLSVKTVRNYLSRIFGKLQVADRAEAAIQARRAGLGT
ncbi:response regulator transcription factor [Streptomyces sp. NPDC049954]|uniref:response regulator transcription factor n=1 Tax=Streptomyces sp. NPDC049954 TaxID=3155779 RepID=UPI003416468F